mmetsp:Transcript_29831/g.58423  ORF Transcript_29831/g.58423 Transcript_29831/m.58423 type:complete len:429 (-) Transcript_29831:168-1454(-)|eukprot:CAMPEP_0175145682 /NCGR_PEP_ID=MMETSP0087-20121206/14922_1 /TAXON_ID=136419 /ORGANISM="Unknown Unknown, Strain D1" /LENGTH=428 /DNA_ID=CAMNT_0016430487 /DNA_START=21 /DNA_END=1307 /DNA_ORIENTATION=+
MQLLVAALLLAAASGAKQHIRFGNFISNTFTDNTAPIISVDNIPVGSLKYNNSMETVVEASKEYMEILVLLRPTFDIAITAFVKPSAKESWWSIYFGERSVASDAPKYWYHAFQHEGTATREKTVDATFTNALYGSNQSVIVTFKNKDDKYESIYNLRQGDGKSFVLKCCENVINVQDADGTFLLRRDISQLGKFTSFNTNILPVDIVLGGRRGDKVNFEPNLFFSQDKLVSDVNTSPLQPYGAPNPQVCFHDSSMEKFYVVNSNSRLVPINDTNVLSATKAVIWSATLTPLGVSRFYYQDWEWGAIQLVAGIVSALLAGILFQTKNRESGLEGGEAMGNLIGLVASQLTIVPLGLILLNCKLRVKSSEDAMGLAQWAMWSLHMLLSIGLIVFAIWDAINAANYSAIHPSDYCVLRDVGTDTPGIVSL